MSSKAGERNKTVKSWVGRGGEGWGGSQNHGVTTEGPGEQLSLPAPPVTAVRKNGPELPDLCFVGNPPSFKRRLTFKKTLCAN